MKKKNLLTLGALCLSLGLVVSSCNNTTSPSQPGEPGKPGEDGKPGKDGADGKTYKDVIVIHDNNLDGGDVEQDVYFVTEGEHDKVTFTFVPENESDNIVIDFEINGEVVEDLDPSSTSYTIEDADKYEGTIQVTGATFTSVDAYGTLLLERHVEELNKKDTALSLVKLGTTNTVLDEKELTDSLYGADATAAVQEAWEDANEEVLEAIEDAKTEHKNDVKAQVEAIKTVAQTGIEAIDKAYEQAVSDAKVQATSDLEDLAASLTHDSYTEENAKTDLDTYKAKIEAATTIKGLTAVINGTSINQTTKGSEANLFYGAKALAFSEVDAALSKLEDSGLIDELDTSTTKGLALVQTLKDYGVDVSKLPTTIAEEQYALISASTDVKVVQDSTTKQYYTEIGKAGAEAVEDSVLGIKDQLVSAIKTKYESEINDSKVLADQTSTKTALLGVLETAIQNYVTADTNDTRFSISQYVSTEVNVGTDKNGGTNAQIVPSTKEIKSGTNKLGLIGYIEYCLNQPVNGSTNQAWLAERISNAKATVGEQLKTARDNIKDETYDKLASYSSKKVGNTTYYYPEVSVVLEGQDEKPADQEQAYIKVENPFFSNYSTATEGNAKGSASLVLYSGNAIADVTVGTSTTAEKITYNLDEWLDTLSKANVTKESTSTDDVDSDGVWTGGTLYVESWVETHKNDFVKIYTDGLAKLHGHWDQTGGSSTMLSKIVKQAALNSGLTGNTSTDYITSSKLFDIWDAFVTNDPTDENFADASTLISTAEGMKKCGTLLQTANDQILEWLDKVEITDSDFRDFFGTPASKTSTSLVREAFENEVKAIIAGEVNNSQLTSWFKRLDSVYKTDVTEYLETAKDLVTQKYQESVSNVSSVEDSRKLTGIYDSFNSYIGHKLKWDSTTNSYVIDDEKGKVDLYLCTTIESINKWTADARGALELTGGHAKDFVPPLFERLPGNSGEAMEDFNFDNSEVEFKNSDDFKVVNRNGIYVASGELATMTAEQATAWGTTEGTKFALISYEAPTNAKKRFAGWTNSILSGVEGLKEKDTVGDTDGSNIVKVNLGEKTDGLGSKKYYQVIFTDDKNTPIAIYVFDFSAYVSASTEASN